MRRSIVQRLSVRRVIVAEPQHAVAGTETLLLTRAILSARDAPAAPQALDADPDVPAIYLTGSGTTGEYKIFSMSQQAIVWRSARMVESEAAPSDYRVLMPVSVEHPPAKTKRLNTFYLGFTSAFQPAPGPRIALPELCANLHVTCVDMGVLHAESAVRDASRESRFPANTTVYVSGSRVSAQLRRAFEQRFGQKLHVHYGAREFGRISTTWLGDADEALESVGAPAPWVEFAIVDGEGAALPAGAIGELRVRADCMSDEYVGDPVATARHFRDGWYYPRDLASLTCDGILCVHGRADDMMILNSIKIFPAEIERVLEAHPGVKAAAAFAKPSRAHGDIPLAAVELHESAAIAGEALLACVRDRLGVRAPRRIIVVDALPRNAAGKILKNELIDLLERDG
jgi:acyl-coenzyme A synthetase/AMP-(fatty) acid ligase